MNSLMQKRAPGPIPICGQALFPTGLNRAVGASRGGILVAEDDPCDALLVEQAMVKAGLHLPTHFLEDGQQVIDYLQGLPPFANRESYPLPELLLLDLKLPVLD